MVDDAECPDQRMCLPGWKREVRILQVWNDRSHLPADTP